MSKCREYTVPIAKKCQKCAGMGLKGFISKKINENWNIRKKKNPWSRLSLDC